MVTGWFSETGKRLVWRKAGCGCGPGLCWPPSLTADPGRAMKVLLLTGLGALFFAYYWADNFDPGGLDYLVLNHLGAAPAGTRARSAQGTSWLLQVNFLSYVQLTSFALPSLTDSKGSLVVVSSLLGHVPKSFSSPYSAAKFALDSFFGSLQRELDVQDVNVAITMCVLGLQDRASTVEGVRGVARTKAAVGPKAALAVIRGGATRASRVFYPWRFHMLCLLRAWLPRPRAWFIRQELNVTA
ncbi:PREDICTED: hydroxysteroid 11-beta-dehydrogenase 1-like protein isoform X3 [Miniopterus natalensis]|uniref:hydroxysteroid 11-beta-dehydrogenase 1-like protein isoform X3 n=2 Tax=Miniopterus natalensis TaxID=291302 RepID=UPI0007A6EE67|nr:PREDICTED: hydroxysteroid 11-beta-dehydrogenase 1-like protein isoform X3 [Miniopterus natalensis]